MAKTLTDNDISRLAQFFWSLVGEIEPFPRSLEGPVLWGLPLAIVKLPRLGLSSLRNWLFTREIIICVNQQDRPLRGCLVAHRGQGLVFLDGTDSDDERRFSLGHEVSHFLRDYLIPRQQAIGAFGQNIVGILDGERDPTVEERLNGVLRGLRIGMLTHLIERGDEGFAEKSAIREAEDGADLLALELLAPQSEVALRVRSAGLNWRSENAHRDVTTVLVHDFGLPLTVAERYSCRLVYARRPAKSFREWLG